MKMPGVKNLNWKNFFVDHGEKIGLGAAVLFGLAAMGMSRWAPYRAKDPYELVQQSKKAEADQKTSVWPEEKQKELASEKNIAEKAQRLITGLDESRYVFGRTLDGFYVPVIPPRKQVEEPKWFAVQQLVADYGTGVFAKAPAIDETLVASTEGESSESADGQIRSGTRPRTTGTATGRPTRSGRRDLDDILPAEQPQGEGAPPPGMSAPGGGHGGPGGGHGGEGKEGKEGGKGRRPAARGPAGPPMSGPPGMGGGPMAGRGPKTGRGTSSGGPGGGHGGPDDSASIMAGMYGSEGGYGASGPVEALPKRYVAVRGVFPIKDQEKALAEARGAQSTAEVAGLIEFTDFELERQRAVAGDDPWTTEWEKVDYLVAKDVLNEVADFAFDEVDPSVTNPIFTMPLPGRLGGSWGEKASHPLLSQYELTEDFKRKHEWLQRKIAEYAQQLEEQNQLTVKPGGFGDVQYNAGQIGREMMGNSDYMSEMMGTMRGGFSGGQPGANGQDATQLKPEEIKAMITASGTYLLFRYIDFDVQPGNAYRYRVRLQLRNPNEGLPADQLASPEVADKPTRWTEWSDPSPPVVVLDDTSHYLVNIERPGLNQPERARFELFEWSKETGTVVKEEVSVEPGHFIGGTAKAKVLDLAANTFEPKDFNFTSNDMLVDIDRGAANIAAAHTDWGLDRRFQIPSQVLVVDESGQLAVQDPVSDAEPRAFDEEYIKKRDEAYAYLEQAAAPAGGEEGAMPGTMMSGMYGEGEGAGANPLRRRGGRGRGGMGGASSGMSGSSSGMSGGSSAGAAAMPSSGGRPPAGPPRRSR